MIRGVYVRETVTCSVAELSLEVVGHAIPKSTTASNKTRDPYCIITPRSTRPKLHHRQLEDGSSLLAPFVISMGVST
jgi:hypothetical protein